MTRGEYKRRKKRKYEWRKENGRREEYERGGRK